MEQINEQWRPIEGYEGQYEVSNMGRVRSLDRFDCRGHRLKGTILRPKTDCGYLRVNLLKEGKQKMFLVHRLVAQAFIPNLEGLSQINHKDEDKTNNVVFLKDDGTVDKFRSNLEWCDRKYNCNYGTTVERQIRTKIRKGLADPELCGLTEKERKHIYNQKNREKIMERKRLYYQKNRERLKEYQREYRRRKKTSNVT